MRAPPSYQSNGIPPSILDMVDVEAEKRLLGAIILNPSLLLTIEPGENQPDSAGFTVRDLWRPEYKPIYRAAAEVERTGSWDQEEGGLTAVRRTLLEANADTPFDTLTDLVAMAELFDAVPALAEHLHALATRRRVYEGLHRAMNDVVGEVNPTRIQARLQAVLDNSFGDVLAQPDVQERPEGDTELVAVPLVSLRNSLLVPDPPTEYVVDGLLNRGGTSCLSGPFKGGKSTLFRILCVAAASGLDFLGRSTTPCNVGYVSLEEERGGVKEHFRLLSELSPDEAVQDRIMWEVGDQWLPAKLDEKIDMIYETIVRNNLGLLVIGPLQDFFGFRNINDYSEVKPALRAFTNKVARTTGCHVSFDHHNNKFGTGRAAFLGSVAIGGGVDQLLTLTVVEDESGQVLGRGLTTWQRYGISMLNLLGLEFVPNRLETSLGPPPERLKDQAGLQQLAIKITALCHTWTEARVIEQEVGGNKQERIAATSWAVDQGMLVRRPRKGRGGGYEYLDRALLRDDDDLGTGSGTGSEGED